jgi:peptidyl-prolyl cis-trans isomerase D
VAGLRAPRLYAAAAQVFESEVRDLSLALVHPGLIGEVPQPTDAQLTTFMRENAANLRRPEFRALTIVRFEPPAQAAAAQTPVDPAEVQRRFEFRRESLSTPERRTLVQVPARTAEAAAQAAQRLRAGEAPGAVARALGVEAVTFNSVPATAIPTAAWPKRPSAFSPARSATRSGASWASPSSRSAPWFLARP